MTKKEWRKKKKQSLCTLRYFCQSLFKIKINIKEFDQSIANCIISVCIEKKKKQKKKKRRRRKRRKTQADTHTHTHTILFLNHTYPKALLQTTVVCNVLAQSSETVNL